MGGSDSMGLVVVKGGRVAAGSLALASASTSPDPSGGTPDAAHAEMSPTARIGRARRGIIGIFMGE
jgi:hypothetical protein